ncbi:MAG: multicopper oxidase domain-containing protein [Rhodoblastus sp.]
MAGSLCTSPTAVTPRDYLRDAGALAAKLSQLAVGVSTASPVDPNAYAEPPVFSSTGGVLDIMMIAKPKRISTIAFTPPGGDTINPIGWVFEICPRPATGLDCPANSSTVSDYGGVRLALQQGDRLKIRFVNRLPPLDPVKVTHSSDPGGANLPLNPTNLHTHGLIVPARVATANDPTYGDYVFVDVFNSANGQPAAMKVHAHSLVATDYVDYRIDIPYNHPSGLFWFHPHVHGLALNQIQSGMAGIITIGNSSSYLSGFTPPSTKHLILKDLQVLAAGVVNFDNGPAAVSNGEVLNQQDSGFCDPGMVDFIRRGSCPGTAATVERLANTADGDGGGNDYSGGRWYFTINGRVYPTIPVSSPNGDIWRLTNASGGVSYKLKLIEDSTGQDMILQIVAIDGVSVSLPQDASASSVIKLAGAKFTPVQCPGVTPQTQPQPVCAKDLVMFPSSRAEVWVAHRDSWGNVDIPPAGATATLRMDGLTMGTGDAWPVLNLASVVFGPAQVQSKPPAALSVQGDASRIVKTGGVFAAPAAATPAPLPAGCKALAAGNRRRIFFGLADLSDGVSFGLGYEEVDSRGNPVPGTQVPVARFDPDNPTVCLPLGAFQQPVHETWELVQLSTENHNFHIHQTKFRVIDQPAAPSPFTSAPTTMGIVEDNLPLGVATPDATISDLVMNSQNGVCSVDQWRSGKCATKTVYVDIPFSQLGDFVYHCHILEHEDGGMMAKIRVVPSP